ncbi:MAG: hypothetical protein ABSG44_12770 [Thermodesulfobacteriota bacterium]
MIRIPSRSAVKFIREERGDSGGEIGIGKAGIFAAFNTEVTVLEKFNIIILPKNWTGVEGAC